MSQAKLFLAGITKLFSAWESLVCYIPPGDGNKITFIYCVLYIFLYYLAHDTIFFLILLRKKIQHLNFWQHLYVFALQSAFCFVLKVCCGCWCPGLTRQRRRRTVPWRSPPASTMPERSRPSVSNSPRYARFFHHKIIDCREARSQKAVYATLKRNFFQIFKIIWISKYVKKAEDGFETKQKATS